MSINLVIQALYLFEPTCSLHLTEMMNANQMGMEMSLWNVCV